tara:strand:+ start:1365 stop:2504 length:1140 start_codon:yes stop_codon:yes gene_type:complete
MAVNEALIKGAGIASSRFVDAGAAVGQSIKSLQPMFQQLQANKLRRKKENAAIDRQVGSYVDALNSDVDLLGLNAEEESTVTRFLSMEKNRYVEISNQLARVKPGSEVYLELKNELGTVQRSFSTLADQLKAYKTRKTEYLDDFQTGRISNGDIKANKKAADIYTNQAAFGIGADGQVIFNDNGENLLFNDFKDPPLKAYPLANNLLKQNEAYYNGGAQMSQANEDLLRNNLTSQFSKDPSAMASIVDDDLLGELSLTMEINEDNPASSIPEVVDVVVNSMKEVAQGSYNRRQEKLNAQASKRENKDLVVTNYEIVGEGEDQRYIMTTAGGYMKTGDVEGYMKFKNQNSSTPTEPLELVSKPLPNQDPDAYKGLMFTEQ